MSRSIWVAKKLSTADEECGGASAGQRCEGRLDLGSGVCIQDQQIQAEHTGRSLQFAGFSPVIRPCSQTRNKA